jgi:hypothetical protein
LILAFHKLTSFRDKTGAREDNHEPGRVKAWFGQRGSAITVPIIIVIVILIHFGQRLRLRTRLRL